MPEPTPDSPPAAVPGTGAAPPGAPPGAEPGTPPGAQPGAEPGAEQGAESGAEQGEPHPGAAAYRQARFRRPPGATELLLIRHGESQAAYPDKPFPLVGGHADPELAEEGREQAERLAGRLARTRIDAIYVTSLRRTAQTAAPLAARLGLVPQAEPDLREVHLGEWEAGLFRKMVADNHPLAEQMWAQERWDVIPGAEPAEVFAARVGGGAAPDRGRPPRPAGRRGRARRGDRPGPGAGYRLPPVRVPRRRQRVHLPPGDHPAALGPPRLQRHRPPRAGYWLMKAPVTVISMLPSRIVCGPAGSLSSPGSIM